MARHCSRPHVNTLETGWHVIIPQARGIEPLFEAGDGTVVAIQAAIPNTPECGYLIKSSPLSCFQCQAWIGFDRKVHDVRA